MLTAVSQKRLILERLIELMHHNVQKYGTIFNTVAAATKLEGTARRKGTETL